jgi:NO-binding membrane sensor protein with MHYT domain
MYPVILLMACSIGGVAIWAMHFVGMSAVSLSDSDGNPIDQRYRYDFTLISLVAVVLMCFVGIYLCATDEAYTIDKNDTVEAYVEHTSKLSISEIRKQKVTATEVVVKALTRNIMTIIIGGVLMGSGVCVMHFLGMAAVVIDADIHWEAGAVAASVIIAIVASTAAYWIIFRFLALYPHIEAFRFASATVAAIAVNGMHYTGMAAATYTHNPGKAALTPLSASMGHGTAVMGAVIVSVMLMFAVVLFVIMDIRSWFYAAAKVNRIADTMMKTLEREQIESPALNRILEKVRLIRPQHSSHHCSRSIYPLILLSPSHSPSHSSHSCHHFRPSPPLTIFPPRTLLILTLFSTHPTSNQRSPLPVLQASRGGHRHRHGGGFVKWTAGERQPTQDPQRQLARQCDCHHASQR